MTIDWNEQRRKRTNEGKKTETQLQIQLKNEKKNF